MYDTTRALFINHCLNHKEALRRIAYWAGVGSISEQRDDQALSNIKLLVALLETREYHQSQY